MSTYRPDTICVQEGWKPKKGEPRVLPIYQSTTFKYDTTDEMGRLFALEDEGYFYTRLQNPTNDAVAAKIAALEGGVAAMLTSSGQAANFYTIANLCQETILYVLQRCMAGRLICMQRRLRSWGLTVHLWTRMHLLKRLKRHFGKIQRL